ncbi:MAG: murein transglycosylase A [Deltaproteobacteria bacterium]|nr:murein transglycosylase A [Deltaproteobacteria bacterium]
MKTAVLHSLAALRNKHESETLAVAGQPVTVAQMRESLASFLSILEESNDVQAALQRKFSVYKVTNSVLFTGYHEPVLRGSRVRTGRFRYPLYRRPDDLVEIETASATKGGEKQFGRMMNGQFFPYFSREEIDGKGVLSGKHYELLWVEDPVSLFLLHVQGSGQILLPDGTRLRVGYAASNGRPYKSIGKLLIEQGKLGPGEATTPAIRRYLQAHPAEQSAVLFANPRYVFFQLTTAEGPHGSLGVPLTPGRSLAVDLKLYPVGALAFIRTKRPVVESGGRVAWKEFSRFVLLQDTGAAISGWRRADLFWGADAEAEAGLMSQEGELYLLVKKP